MLINIKDLIIHIANSEETCPILSLTPIFIENDIKDYISTTIEKSFCSDDAKICDFRPESTVWSQCNSSSWNLIAISQSITDGIFTIMKRNKEIPSADLVYGVVEIERSNYFFMLKLDYKSAYTHFVHSSNHKTTVNFIKNNSLLPSQASKISEGFFISMAEPIVKVIEKKYMVDGIKDYYISTQILACTETLTSRQKATKLVKVANKIADLYYQSEDNISEHITSTIYEEFKQHSDVSIEKLGTKFFKENPIAQNEFYQMLSAENICKEESLSLSERFKKRFQKQAIKTESGVEIKIPTQLYSNEDEIQFINNPDGTVSLLIKNIKLS